MKKKHFYILSVIFILSQPLFGQDSTHNKSYVRNFIGTTPNKKNVIINGVAFGFWCTEPWGKADRLKINGLNLDAGILNGFVGLIYGGFGSFQAPFTKADTGRDYVVGDLQSFQVFTPKDTTLETKITGISLSIGGLGRSTQMNGFSLNGILSLVNELNGVEISGIYNIHYSFKGIMICGLRNKATEGKGLQIALFNNCKHGKLIQFGLLNRIGKRVIPFCNFSFK